MGHCSLDIRTNMLKCFEIAIIVLDITFIWNQCGIDKIIFNLEGVYLILSIAKMRKFK